MRRQTCVLLHLQFLNSIVDWINANKGGRAIYVMHSHFYAMLMNIAYEKGQLVTVPKYDYTQVTKKWLKRAKVSCYCGIN